MNWTKVKEDYPAAFGCLIASLADQFKEDFVAYQIGNNPENIDLSWMLLKFKSGDCWYKLRDLYDFFDGFKLKLLVSFFDHQVWQACIATETDYLPIFQNDEDEEPWIFGDRYSAENYGFFKCFSVLNESLKLVNDGQ